MNEETDKAMTSTHEEGILLRLDELQNTDPATLNATQKMIEPYVDNIVFVWWVVWTATLSYVCVMYVLKPLFQKLVASKNER